MRKFLISGLQGFLSFMFKFNGSETIFAYVLTIFFWPIKSLNFLFFATASSSMHQIKCNGSNSIFFYVLAIYKLKVFATKRNFAFGQSHLKISSSLPLVGTLCIKWSLVVQIVSSFIHQQFTNVKEVPVVIFAGCILQKVILFFGQLNLAISSSFPLLVAF